MPTRLLLQLAAFAAIGCVLGAVTTMLNTAIASFSPPLYALTGSLWMLVPMTARLWSILTGSATVVGALTGLLMMPFTALGVLLPLSLIGQGLVFDLILWKAERPAAWRLMTAAGVTGILIGVCSLPVINPETLSVALVIAVIVLRLVAMIAFAALAAMLVRQLTLRGVRPLARTH